MKRFIVLLRAINVGKRQMAMAALRELAAGLGYDRPETYVASGNLIVGAESAERVERELPPALAARFGFAVEIVVRDADALRCALALDAFPEASARTPNLVFLLFSQAPARPDALDLLRARASPGEHLRQDEHALWLHAESGVAGSKLSPAFIDKAMGSPTTARNIRTVRHLVEMAS